MGAATAASVRSDRVFGQGGDDLVTTGVASDYVEGGSGADVVHTGSGVDDVIGGSSAADGRPLGTDGTRLPGLRRAAARHLRRRRARRRGRGPRRRRATTWSSATTVGSPARRPAPGMTVPRGGDGRHGRRGDVRLRPAVRRRRTTTCSTGSSTTACALGGGDLLEGGTGNDVLLGDLATVKRRRRPRARRGVEERQRQRDHPRRAPSSRRRWCRRGQAQNGGPDVARGGTGNDVLHLGGGDDVGNGEAGDDTVFGGDGDDGLWGGLAHDRLFGGRGADDLDLKKRSGDPALYDQVRSVEDRDGVAATTNGADLVYGGWGPDELQGDEGSAGRTATTTDHLVDWVGAHNVYYVCGGAYGLGKIVRESSPAMMDLLTRLAEASGAKETATTGSGGWYDLGLVTNSDRSANTARSPEHPGHFTCG